MVQASFKLAVRLAIVSAVWRLLLDPRAFDRFDVAR
jgi:hypothetical protein